MKISILDMGDEKYGDCILCSGGGKTILIDGGHAGDIRRRGSTPALPDQLGGILGQKPFSPDLLIVTHCHADHIGCLPALVSGGILTPKAALLADPDLGFGTGAGPADVVDPQTERLVAALREEPQDAFASDAELAAFIQDAATLETRYRGMIEALRSAGAPVVLYRGLGDGAQFEAAFKALGLRVLGPTGEHLRACGQAIAEFVRRARARVGHSRANDADASDTDLYRLLVRQPSEEDMPGKGAALNDQSIVVSVAEGGQAALLTGDMQFAQPEQPGLDDLMAALRKTVTQAGPYAMVKLAHHGSDNGTDQALLDGLGASVFTISGGRQDPGHPNPATLNLLSRQSDVTWARTDRNGLIACDLDHRGAALSAERGTFDDSTPNAGGGGEGDMVPAASDALSGEVLRPADEFIQVTARIPHVATRVTITVDVAPPATPAPVPVESTPQRPGPTSGPKPAKATVPAKPDLPPAAQPYDMKATGKHLLFVTSLAKLSENIGVQETQMALQAIKRAGHELLDIRATDDPYPEVRQKAGAGRFDGVVVLGGYDVLPSARMDVLYPELRRRLPAADIASDLDQFLVWNDQFYGDTDGDELPELPVSRIPDGRSSALVRAALMAGRKAGKTPFGLRNVNRPYAETVFTSVPGAAGAPLCSHPQVPGNFTPAKVAASAYYIMLHGSYNDTSRFWGEDANGYALEAFNLGNVPSLSDGVVLSGCCWGALTVRSTALSYRPGTAVQALTPEQSIALAFLAAGVDAFVGSTGSHYSVRPPETAPTYYGGPMHVAFWTAIAQGMPPAPALFEAKKRYAAAIPHGVPGDAALAVELKTLRQFTCLGLGW